MMSTVCLMKVLRVKYLNKVLRKSIILIFLGLKFLSNFPKQNLDVRFVVWEENWIFHGQERINHF
jgi:hypothetical protein